MNDRNKKLTIHLSLFVITLLCTTLAGAEWMYGKYLYQTIPSLSWNEIVNGFHFSIPFLFILTCHEFGHYLVARMHRINVTLPYYIPMWLGFVPIPIPTIGTMGAFIRIKEHIASRKHYFDVGVAGPLAGFLVAIALIWYGFAHLPAPEYIYEVHPEYEKYGLDYADYVYDDNTMSIRLGDNLVFWFFMNYIVEDPSLIPHPYELIHYPYLLAGYLALFFTALNLIPIGQLDGGHIIFGLFGLKRHTIISKILFTIFVFYSGLGVITVMDLQDLSWSGLASFMAMILVYIYFLYLCGYSLFEHKRDRWMYAGLVFTTQFMVSHYLQVTGYSGWLLFALWLGRFIGLYHPPVGDNTPLSVERKIIGWIALVVFVLSFSPRPLIVDSPL